MLLKAKEEKYAIGAFNANNLEQIQAIIEAAEEEKAPVILQASQGAIKYAGLETIVSMVRIAAEKATIPVVLHLDHGTDFDQNVKCLQVGFTSLMFDGSKLPYAENARITKKIVEMGHAAGLPVEAEIGRIPGTETHTIEQINEMYTKPDEAARFVEETEVDAIAVAVGSLHRMTEKAAKLDHDRLKKIKELTDVPLVLHGSSGVIDEELKIGIVEGICKINVATQLNMAFVDGIREAMGKMPDEVDPRKFFKVGKDRVKAVVRDRIRLFGSSGKGK